MIEIRFATKDDVQLLREFICALAEYERLSGECFATEEKLARTLFGKKPAAEALIAYFDGQPAGFALFFQNYSTFLAQPGIYLEDLFVVHEARGHGYGRQLLAPLARIAGERSCGRLEWSVLDWNEPAIGFYKKLGAVPMEDWTIFRLTGDALARLAEQP